MVRPVAALLSLALVAAGCGEHRSKLNQAHPLYVPSAKHVHRLAGTIYPDEVGENIVGLATPYTRVIALFGQPLRRRGDCIEYRIAGSPGRGWRFCFAHGRMSSATGFVKLP